MADQLDEERRVAALCKSLGELWSENDVVDIQCAISEDKLIECRKTLFGKLHARPNVHFPSFVGTMTRVWKVDRVNCSQLGTGHFSFTFQSEEEKQRVLDTGPWCFSNNLLVLKECDPDTPDICYDFSKCAFWVNFYGLPFGRVTNEVIGELASKLGEVIAVKLEPRGNSHYKMGKAKVILNLENPLKTGILVNLAKKKVWVECKYERLPHYCYSCGRMGHYATACKEIPYEKSGLPDDLPGRYGHWLRADVQELSPYGKIFYGKQDPVLDDTESVPETPMHSVSENENQ